MRRCAILPAVTAVLCLAVAHGAEAPSPDRIEQLVAQLGSPAYRERVAASRALDSLGEAALDVLRRAAASGDAETRHRATELVERIERRAATARLLAPATVSLDIHQLPRNEAIAEFNKVTGASLRLHTTDAIGSGGRRVTLRTGPVTFWDALEQFCKAADLREWDGITSLGRGSPPAPVNAQPPAIQMPGVAIRGQIIINGTPSRPPAPPAQFVLLEGPDVPTAEARNGAVRVRCLPPGTPFPADAIGSDEVLFPLHVAAEPRLQLQGGVTLRIEKAVDDRGQSLVATAVTAKLQRNAVAEEEQRMMLMLINNGIAVPLPAAPAGPVGIKVRRGPAGGTVLRELTGSVGAQVRITEPLLVVDNPATAGKSESRSPHGVTLAVTEIDKTARGDLRFSVRLSVSPDVQLGQGTTVVARGGLPVPMAAGRGMVLQQMVASSGPGTPPGSTEFCGLALEDAKGRRFEVGQAQQELTQFGPQGLTYAITVAFRTTAEGAGEPAKLVCTGSRPAIIEVPFTLKDVPLP
jgi:hypothetical protein